MKILTRPGARATALALCLPLAAISLPLITAAPAGAATQTITITASGFVPMNQSIKTGDTITFTNADTAVHEIQFRETTGFTCTAKPLVVQKATSQSCTFTAAGKFNYSDPNQRGNTFKGVITVDAAVAATVTLASSASPIVYGDNVNLTGKVVPATAGTVVDIMAKESGDATYTKVGSATTTSGGAYVLQVTPGIFTSYRAEFMNGTAKITSGVTAVEVRPKVTLAKRFIKGKRLYLTSKVVSNASYAGKYLVVQRKNSLGGWTFVKSVTMGNFSSVRFAVRIPKGPSEFRTLLRTSQAGDGYLSNTSNVVFARR